MGGWAAPGSRDHVDVVGAASFSSADGWLGLKPPSQWRFDCLLGAAILLSECLLERLPLSLAALPLLDARRRSNGSSGAQRFHGHSVTRSFSRKRSIARVRIWLIRDSVTPRISPISLR